MNMKAIELEHIVTGMQVVKFIPLDPSYNEATFAISFRTPPTDSSGVQHITEHSVLCGSEKYPTKEPFAILLQSSLQTFLNAMTYNDHTVYPIATRNEKDYYNLANIYLDAVFFPLLHKDERIFAQEGHHVHMEEGWDHFENRGVVLNEMKGVFSDPSSKLGYLVAEYLFKGTTISHNSGGNPKDIIKLTYEQFKKFHYEHYYPGNANVVLMSHYDLGKDLTMLGEYIERSQNKSNTKQRMIKGQKPSVFETFENDFAVTNSSDTGYFASGQLLFDCDSVSPSHFHTLNILDSLLHDAHATPLKKQLFGAKIAETLESSLDYTQNQAYLQLSSKGVQTENFDKWKSIIENFYVSMAQDNDYLTAEAFEGALNKYEFKKSEMVDDYGIHKLQEIQLSWLYDAPFEKFLEYKKYIQEMRQMISDGTVVQYLQKLIKEYFIQNGGVYVKFNPKVETTDATNEEKDQLKLLYSNSSSQEKQKIIDFSKFIHSRQEQIDTPEQLANFPKLAKDDLVGVVETNRLLVGQHQELNGQSVFLFNTNNDNIVYQNVVFDISQFVSSYEMVLPYALLRSIYGKSDTSLSLDKLQTQIDKYLGNFEVDLQNQEFPGGKSKLMIVIKFKYLLTNILEANNLISQILKETQQYLTLNRLEEIINEKANNLKESFLGRAGYYIAQQRAGSGLSASAAVEDYRSGLSFYHYLKKIQLQATFQQLKRLMNQLISECPCLLSVGVQNDKQHSVIKNIQDVFAQNQIDIKILFDKMAVSQLNPYQQSHVAAPVEINYVAKAHIDLTTYRKTTSAILLAQQILSKTYLWDNVRVLGGAYGCFISSTHLMTQNIVSYRDPHIIETVKIFEKMPDYVKSLNVTEEQLTQFKIGAIGERQRSLAPKDRYALALSFFLGNNDVPYWCTQVENIKDVTIEELQRASVEFELLAKALPVVLGSESKIKEAFGEQATYELF